MAEQTGVQGSPLRSGTWNIDAIHSQVFVTVIHMSMVPLRAKLPGVTGRLQTNADNPLGSSFDVEIDATSITTGHPAQEDFMRSEPWLDAEHHPTITFRSHSITPNDGGFTIAGDLTLRGVSKRVEIPAEFRGVVADPWGLRAGFTARVTVDRRDFGITWNRVFDWGLMASYEMEIGLDIGLVFPDESLAQKPQS